MAHTVWRGMRVRRGYSLGGHTATGRVLRATYKRAETGSSFVFSPYVLRTVYEASCVGDSGVIPSDAYASAEDHAGNHEQQTQTRDARPRSRECVPASQHYEFSRGRSLRLVHFGVVGASRKAYPRSGQCSGPI